MQEKRDMDKNIKYSGKTAFYGKETIFDFDGQYLHLYVDEDIYMKLSMKCTSNQTTSHELQKLEIDYLDCSINGSLDRVVFLFGKEISKCDCLNFKIFTISLFVRDYIEYQQVKPIQQDSDYIMVYYSKDLMKCLSLVPFYHVSSDKNESNIIATVELNSDSCKNISYSKINGFDIEISPTFKQKWSGCYFDFIPGLQLKIKNPSDFDFRMKLQFYHALIRLIKYMFMRDNIMPELMEFQHLGTKGIIASNCYINYEKEEEKANEIYSSFIYWNSIYLVAGKLLKEIIDGNMLLNNIPEKRINRIMVNDATISKDAAEFEYEFGKTYPNGIPHSEKSVETENIVKSKLEKLRDCSSGDEKKYYKQFIKHIKQESLKGKILFSFNENSRMLDQFKQRLGPNMSFDEIADECAGIRNTVDHGKDDKKITSDTAACYVLLRMLIYAMQLKRIGLEENDIINAIRSLFKIKELISLML